MLAEIYLLKLEAAVRAAKEAADHRCDLAVCAGHLTGWQGVIPTFHRVLAICPPELGAPPGFRTIQVYPKDLPPGRW